MPGPSFFRLRCPPGSSWPGLPLGESSQVWAAYLELDRTQWLAPDEIARGQLAQVRTLLDHCVQHVPYYQELLAGAGLRPADIQSADDFRRIPLLSRETYQRRYASIIARQLPPGTMATGTTTSSGTSGLPVEVRLTNMVNLWWLAFYLRDLDWCGFDPRSKLAGIRPLTFADPQQQRQFREGMWIPHWHAQIHRVIETGRSFGIDLHTEPRRQLAWLRQVAPEYLLSYPSNLEYLAHLVLEDGKPLAGLQAIQAIAETLTQEMQSRIEQALGVPVRNLYSCAEGGYLASYCPAGHGLHIHAENVILEVLNDQGQPCGPGETGRVVLTTLHNFLTPFLRYEILDDATLGPARCPCGRGLPLLARVDGKTRPMLHLPGGGRKSSAVLVGALHKLGGTCQQQVIQKAVDHVVVHVVPARSWTAEHAARIAELVNECFETRIRTEVQVVDRLELPPHGKLREVMVEI